MWYRMEWHIYRGSGEKEAETFANDSLCLSLTQSSSLARSLYRHQFTAFVIPSPTHKHTHTTTYQSIYFLFMIDDLPDRNCSRCEQCCFRYETWLQFQNCLYNVWEMIPLLAFIKCQVFKIYIHILKPTHTHTNTHSFCTRLPKRDWESSEQRTKWWTMSEYICLTCLLLYFHFPFDSAFLRVCHNR